MSFAQLEDYVPWSGFHVRSFGAVGVVEGGA